MNEKLLFNDSWSFAKTDLNVVSPKGLTFEEVALPHDWLIYNTQNLYENSIGWYKKSFYYHKDNHRLLLCFDGVYMDSTLYVNGKLIGAWKYGYSSFEHDVTEALNDGQNEILLKVVHQSPNSRWYSGAGIYRNVWLKTRDINYIATNGVYISTKQLDDDWQVEVMTDLILHTRVVLSHTISYGENLIASSSQMIYPKSNTLQSLGEANLLQNKSESETSHALRNSQLLVVQNPLLWCPDSPNLYKLTTVLEEIPEETKPMPDESGEISSKPIESITQNLGFKSIFFDPNQGLILNGTNIKLYGVCEHHDLGALGAAFNKIALARRLKLLKEMGVNAIRTAHNMPAPELMDLADEMGFLINSDAFDMWERPKTTYDYARFFIEWSARDVKSWVMRDRNHPSLILWSIGNEIYDTHADSRGLDITKRLINLVSQYDPKKNAFITFGSNYIPWENTQKCADLLKIVGYNYAARYYNEHHHKYANWVIYGSETASTVQSRGIYHFPLEQSLLADDDEQCSSLGNSSTSWGAASTEECITSDRDTPFSLGQFIWTGFDYIGEPTPYHTKNSYFGQLDTATFKKDSYYIYQAEWTDYRISPMIHIFPYWDFNIGQQIDVRVCSNAPLIELFLNRASVGKYRIDHVHGKQLVGSWKVPYSPGELMAIAYDEEGNILASDIRRSFGDAAKIKLCSDKYTLDCNGQDILFVEISMEDIYGNLVYNANNRVFVKVTGAGNLIGLDNGDSTDYDQYKGASRRLFSGKLMALIGSTMDPGNIRIEVTSKGMDAVWAEFESIPFTATSSMGASAFTSNSNCPIVTGSFDEIPLRKLEIIVSQVDNSEFKLDSNRREMSVMAILHPENTSYRDVQWSIVNASGIPVNNAKVKANGLEAKVTALADGEFYLRCTSNNGTNKTKLISHLEFAAKGIGDFYKNPYEFISAGLYDYSNGNAGNGNEKGIATARDIETIVGYRNIDFGSYGSDRITIPIFTLSGEEYPIQIWEGIPEEANSKLLTEVIYQKPSKWNVYQEETFLLPRRLKGITSISFVLNNKIHIKGFSFQLVNRAFENNYAIECDKIYGDDFTRLEDSIIHVGNNVSLEYNDMDFTDIGVTKITIHGKSHIDKNTIIIRTENHEGERSQLVSFTRSEGLTTQTFEIEKLKDSHKVTFIFLPGCNFDFKWFIFEA